MSSPSTTIDDHDIRCGDLELTDSAIDALAQLLVDAALREIKEDPEVAA